MQVDTHKREARLSVGELAAFRNRPQDSKAGAGAWRAKLGQQWHLESARQTRAEHPEAAFEQTIIGKLRHHDWTIKLQGRIDQVIPSPDILTLREVKTVRQALPCPLEELRDQYPEYFAQVAIYLRLAELLPEYAGESLRAELLFIEISSGTVQIVPIEDDGRLLVETRLEHLTAFLDDRRARRVQLDQLEIHPAFPSLRPGQLELIRQLPSAALKRPTVLLQAPTGFGKTGIVLEHALRQMQNGLYERCIYLTSKSSGQLETVRQLQGMIGQNLRFIQMRNRREHRIDSPMHRCTGDRRCEDDLGQRWMEADIHPPELLREGTLSIERAKEIGRQTGVCPYALTKACLPFAELWIGDSNYLFAPHSRHVFSEPYGFDPAKTILIIDEAHNLPSRNADALSIELNAADLFFAIEELREAGASRRLLGSLERVAIEIDRFAESEVPGAEKIYALGDLLEEAASFLEDCRFDYEAVAPFALETVWRIPELASRLDGISEDWLCWAPRAAVMRAQCLDAGQWTDECLKPFASRILMSATLEPLDNFHDELGIAADETSLAIGWADWREHAYDVAIDCRVDTRMKQRKKYYETTALTIWEMTLAAPEAPTVVFFSSYQYAENVRAYLSAIDNSLRVAIQPRGVDLSEQETFIDESLLCADVLFLIIGSSYSEGIDKLGGRVGSVIVVGPALPEVNPVQNAKMRMDPALSREAAFQQVYLVPAMRRIHQALGRIVRAPGQSAKILLHCKRYAQEQYRQMLQTEYQTEHIIRKDSSFRSWLERKNSER
ncbi:MAG TPA: helicase C-terminal domain-containing protein [Opitutales bacterium]|nr:helicase C-terminal domain-containing protein [Opitutales bacterium]